MDKTIRTGTYPYDVETLKYVLFSDYEAEGLTDRISFYFPEGVKVCRTHLFRECPHAMDIYFRDDLEEIADYTFYECKNFHFPNLLENKTIKKIRSFGFYGCENIQEYLANMPDQIEEILLRSMLTQSKKVTL